MMVIDKDGYIFRAVPNMVPVKDARGNWSEVRQGWKREGIPLMRVPFSGVWRKNRALEILFASGELVELMDGEGAL